MVILYYGVVGERGKNNKGVVSVLEGFWCVFIFVFFERYLREDFFWFVKYYFCRIKVTMLWFIYFLLIILNSSYY